MTLTHAGSCCVTLGEPRNRTSAPDRRVCPSAFAAGFRGYLKSVTAELSEKIMRADAGLSNRVRYLARLIAHYSEFHRIAHFAGNLDSLKVAYANSDAEAKPILLRQFDAIAHQLNMANGVSKTTFADRLENDLAAVLSAVKLPDAELRVLDLPSSTGIACIRSLAQLQERYQITSYVLGDKFHAILYDPCRQCVFDDQGNLLQVGFNHVFFTTHRGSVLGSRYSFLTKVLAFPHRLIAWYLRRRFHFNPDAQYKRLPVVHPAVEELLGKSAFGLQEIDVFQPIPGRYELILSFNLLSLYYFTSDAISVGIRNLAAALSEGGFLILGNWQAVAAFQKREGSLVLRFRKGNWKTLGVENEIAAPSASQRGLH
jgi:hypothetical protein